ncbi:hypothetical protein [Massilia sp. YMA4]|uniref:hypothetical protein n=1 Tax=Massilia sp. YMA4 TaxID=1593482 RepID=UPI000DD0FCC4|nr:hypothetical protein [Massilia sp. YMA4]AXA90802.1 hypothetical protein DPH57_06250 [Massilia sp. YMA4]
MIARMHKLVRELGWNDALLYALARALRPLGARLHRYYFVAQRVTPPAAGSGWGKRIEVRAVAALADIPWGYPRPRDVLAQRLRQGGRSLAAWRDGELAGFLWYQFGAYQEDEVRVRYHLPSPRSAWDYDVFVQPHLRLGPTFARLWQEAHRRLHARGVRWTCSRISAFNADSLRAHGRLGTVRLGSATFLVLGRWQCMLASVAPYLHLSRGPADFPHLMFDTDALECAHPHSTREVPCQTESP